jgi:hypothetical protein
MTKHENKKPEIQVFPALFTKLVQLQFLFLKVTAKEKHFVPKISL